MTRHCIINGCDQMTAHSLTPFCKVHHSMSDPKENIDPYSVIIQGVKLDPMLIVAAYGITDMGIAQAIKKLLRCGRKHKNKAQDVREAITSLERHEEIERTI
mgnify:CR=1 FL=1